ncbi:cytoplasmic dynein 2 intermediate chain 1 isoform X1 [Pelobates fuscus]|uniref:cytoplasmic dynein 2 intermediate chain 1 isoform X1 n=1 Tax=Pelobates fuscus TaxID=191477 RepID=UPI002FE4D186
MAAVLSVKNMEDTWKTDELTRHLQLADTERKLNEKTNKEKKHHRDYDDREGKELHKNIDRDRHRERDKGREHTREKERTRDKEKDRKKDKEVYESDRHKVRDEEKVEDKKSSRGDPDKVSGSRQLYGDVNPIRVEKERRRRLLKDGQEKNKPSGDDREQRHRVRKEKEEKIQEKEDNEERKPRHGKHREDLNNEDRERERERRRSERKHSENTERERKHRNTTETPTSGYVEQASVAQKLKARNPREKVLQEGDKGRRHRERSDKDEKTAEKRKRENEAQKSQPELSRDSIKRKETNDEMRMEKEDASDSAHAADGGYDDSNYEEDFEDYDDDFEDESDPELKEPVNYQNPLSAFKNTEMAAIQKAMALENDLIASFPSKEEQNIYEPEPNGRPDPTNKVAHRGIFIDFGTAKQQGVNRQIATKLKKRSTDLLRLIDLDFSCTVSLLDLAPVKEYDMYIRTFGKTNTKQAYVQCNEDYVDRDIQTEEIDLEEKWTQHPGESAVVCGGHKNDGALNMDSVTKMDAQRLTSFLRSAFQVVAVLLEEDRAERHLEWKPQSKEPCMSISDGCFQINTKLPFLQDRNVSRLHFSEAPRHLLLSVHGSCNHAESTLLKDKFVICVWNIWEPTSPQHVLICESKVECCCFGPGKVPLVFAGTKDGSVLVWDLREDTSMHQRMTLSDTCWPFRSATFSTDGVLSKVNHSSPIKAIEPVLSTTFKEHGITRFTYQEDTSGLSFHIATLDETGHLILWVVVELRKDDLAGSQNDLGLIPGGKVKLVHSSSIFLNDSFFPKDVLSLGQPQTLNIKFMPQDSNHFFIGTDIGLVTHGTRYGLIEPPKHYKPLHSTIRLSKVTTIDFSPFEVPAFLAGCSDGCIRLHTTSVQFPVMQWNESTNGQSVTALRWSLTRPNVFFVLDATGCIYIWDLLQNDLQPIAKESTLSDQVLSMAIFGEPEKNNGLMGLALARTSGKVEIQYIKKKWAKPQPKDKDRFSLLLL